MRFHPRNTSKMPRHPPTPSTTSRRVCLTESVCILIPRNPSKLPRHPICYPRPPPKARHAATSSLTHCPRCPAHRQHDVLLLSQHLPSLSSYHRRHQHSLLSLPSASPAVCSLPPPSPWMTPSLPSSSPAVCSFCRPHHCCRRFRILCHVSSISSPLTVNLPALQPSHTFLSLL